MTRRHAAKHEDLIYDVGMHQGEDTDFYLRKGFRVVAFEADPDLANECRTRFSAEIDSGQLVIVEGAIIDGVSEPKITFYKSTVSVFGTVDPEWKDRNERMGWESKAIEVDVVDFAACLEQHGVPHYLKIDIEGADLVCLEKLGGFDSAPSYISIESNKVSLAGVGKEVDLLERLGFDGFKLVQQATITRQRLPKPTREGKDVDYRIRLGSSGMFGTDLPGDWQSSAAVMRAYRRIMWGYRLLGDDSFARTNPITSRVLQRIQKVSGRAIPGWYDTHARHSLVRDG